MKFKTKRLDFFVGKKKRGFDRETDYLVIRTSIFSLFLTKSTFVFKKGLDRLRIVLWLGKSNQITKQVFLW
ncbi:MAG: hypothetical protein COV30_00210 [Candidatus Yanofskybacteria bacterium CG10_big_fil_rev_8_21_14_0_10_37_15]|uniref:Uncharacterized protein n=1 Tax=Candidatus Yanofskybacteria bacterium CG10_big_fil_rev_8_21_14_0_10_37_15 TaxID=1975097 RepID=A0A2H0R6G3_9BACT|nr:MAG: hypothetical protein COV30_00210 [Candidatus Yanofskybacteria bacterium CG10_big_fil_rev_8_21_14_0_10_37_15]